MFSLLNTSSWFINFGAPQSSLHLPSAIVTFDSQLSRPRPPPHNEDGKWCLIIRNFHKEMENRSGKRRESLQPEQRPSIQQRKKGKKLWNESQVPGGDVVKWLGPVSAPSPAFPISPFRKITSEPEPFPFSIPSMSYVPFQRFCSLFCLPQIIIMKITKGQKTREREKNRNRKDKTNK